MELTPVRMHQFVVKEDGLVDVLVPKFKQSWLTGFLRIKMKYPFMKANLDAIGSETWLLIDGNRNVNNIINTLIEKLGEQVHPAHERVSQFFQQLYKNKFISFNEIGKGKHE